MPPYSYRPFRLEVTGTLTQTDPLHIGDGERFSLATDSPLLLDHATGVPYLPATSLRGAIRDHLEREAALLGCDGDVLDSLFGTTPSRGSDAPSWAGRLAVLDAYAQAPAALEVRDHVRLNPAWGAADSGAKFDGEVALPASGAAYLLNLIYEGDSPEDPELILVAEAIRLLSSGQFRLGAKSGWGYGRVQLNDVGYRIFDRSNPAGLASYLSSRLGKPLAPDAVFQFPPALAPRENHRHPPFSSVKFRLRLHFEGPVLVKAPIPPLQKNDGNPADPESYAQAGLREADHTFLHRAGDDACYLPGSSLRGVLRSQAAHIQPELVPSLFGFTRGVDEGAKGLIEVSDGEIAGDPVPVFLDHVAIDRITAAAVDSKKFSQSALASPQFDVGIRIEFTAAQIAELRLAAFLLRDLMCGRLWAGSGVSRGYGYIRSASLLSVEASLLSSLGWQPPAPATSRPGRVSFQLTGPVDFHDPGLSWLWQAIESTAAVNA